VNSGSGHNLIGVGDSSLIGIRDGDSNHNQVGTPDHPLDPRLAPLGDYGGSTPTFALLPGSSALGGGAAPTTLVSPLSTVTANVPVANASLLGVVPNSTVLLLDSEQMLVTALNSNTLTVRRGYNGTTPAPHVANTLVFLVTDQRGQPRLRDAQLDIGAFQSQGFTLTPLPSQTLSAVVGTDFGAGVRVTANDPGLSDFTGGILSLLPTTAANGATANLRSGRTITMNAGNYCDLAASANTTAGSYTLTVESGAGSTTLQLTNRAGVPYNITVSGGDNQTTAVNSTFDSPLLVTVTDQYGNAVAGVTVTFTGSGNGADAGFSDGGVVRTDDNGQASVFATANDVAGSYTVTASVEGVDTAAAFFLTNSDDDGRVPIFLYPDWHW
jgi:hypothetical protein